MMNAEGGPRGATTGAVMVTELRRTNPAIDGRTAAARWSIIIRGEADGREAASSSAVLKGVDGRESVRLYDRDCRLLQ